MKGSTNKHTSVLLEGAVEHLVTSPSGCYVDATFGRGGHSRAILDKLSPEGTLIALDRDPDAIEAAHADVFSKDKRFTIKHVAFSALSDVIEELSLTEKITGILFDLSGP